MESLKAYHLHIAIQWRAYVDQLNMLRGNGIYLFLTEGQIRQRKIDFADFDSKEYDQKVPSCSYLIKKVVGLMESNNDYKSRRMQMVDGKHLSGDHSFKLAKCILSNRAKVFTAMYCIMNEYGQVAAWWFTTGTAMSELVCCIYYVLT